MRLRLASLCSVAIVAVVGCGVPGAEKPTPIAPEDFGARMVDAECEAIAPCLNEYKQSCVSYALISLPDYGAAVVSGRVTYDPQKAQECLDGWAAVTCEAIVEGKTVEPAACKATFTGTVDVGGDCYDRIDCAEGFCDSSGPTCPGTCTAYAAVGDDCASGHAWCDPSDHLYCAFGDVGEPSTCAAPLAVGGDCTVDPCDGSAGAFCLDGTCAGPIAKGGDCSAAPQGCAAGLICHKHVCTTLPGEGERCANVYGTGCGPDLYCASSDKPAERVCTATLPKGAECAKDINTFDMDLGSSGDCDPGLTCAGASADVYGKLLHSGTCQPFAGVGGACTKEPRGTNTLSGCELGLLCDAGVCTELPKTGPCVDGRCGPGSSCNYVSDTESVCKPLKGTGEACTFGTQCLSSTCSAPNGGVGRCASDSTGSTSCREQ